MIQKQRRRKSKEKDAKAKKRKGKEKKIQKPRIEKEKMHCNITTVKIMPQNGLAQWEARTWIHYDMW